MIKRLRLRRWSEYDGEVRKITPNFEKSNWAGVSQAILEAVKIATDKDLSKSFWLDAVRVFVESQAVNSPSKKYPILEHSKKEVKKIPWEYEGRSWAFWLNTFASAYGWDDKTVAELELDDAIALFQEISVDRQIQQEWEWSLSQNAYSYDKATKKSRFNKLPRPNWMLPAREDPVPVKTSPMPAKALPQGVVIIE